jgi:hypothetical protein
MIEVKGLEISLPATLVANLSEQALMDALKDVAEAARAEWIRLAGSTLHTTRQTYIDGIQPVAMAPGVATVSLVGMLPNIIEQGMPETDLRTTLLGPNATGKKKAKDGHYYRAIPFRHATPGGKGQQAAAEAMGGVVGANVGVPMGKAYTGVVTDAKKLGRDVYKKAKTLKASVGEPHTQTRWGKRLAERVAGTPKLKEHHATDIYAGMVRMEKVYHAGGKPQSKYMTFRTISEKVPVGWIRPATDGKHLVEDVAKFVEEIGTATFVAYVEGLTTPDNPGAQR